MSALTDPLGDGLAKDDLLAALAEGFAVEIDSMVQTSEREVAVLAQAGEILDLLRFARDDTRLACDTLIEITGVDYLTYPDWRDERFAVVYLLKSTRFKHRLVIKVRIEEDDARMVSASELFGNADWLEREVWDQYGIHFDGHPNLKRLLNHHEFVGHPLRKDYPVQKRQHLSLNDPMIDELTQLLENRGFKILDDRLEGQV